MLDHREQLVGAARAGGDLRLQVGDVLARVAHRVGPGREQRLERLGLEPPLVDQQKIVDQHAFLVDRGAVGRHRARRDAADVGVMAARGGEEQQPPVGAEHRHDHRDVGQMGAAVVGVVQRVDVARPQAVAAQAQDRAHALAHRAQMHRHVRRIGDQHAVRIEHGAGEVQALLHVDRVGGVLQRHAHLLGDRHEQVVEDLEHDRIGARADRGLPGERLDAAQQQVIARGELGLPAGLDHHGGGALGDDRRASDRRRPGAGRRARTPASPSSRAADAGRDRSSSRPRRPAAARLLRDAARVACSGSPISAMRPIASTVTCSTTSGRPSTMKP